MTVTTMILHDGTTPKYSPDGRGAWVLTYEDAEQPYMERFYFEDAAREYARLLPASYTNLFIELGQTQ